MPKFYKVTDADNKPFSFIKVTKTDIGETATVAEHNSAQNRTTFRELDSFNQRDFTGAVSEIQAAEYAEGLKAWGINVDTGDNAAVNVGNATTSSEEEPSTDASHTAASGSGEAVEGEPVKAVDQGATENKADEDAATNEGMGNGETAGAADTASNTSSEQAASEQSNTNTEESEDEPAATQKPKKKHK